MHSDEVRTETKSSMHSHPNIGPLGPREEDISRRCRTSRSSRNCHIWRSP